MEAHNQAARVLRSLVLPIYIPMICLATGMAAPTPGFPQYLTGLGATVALSGLIVSLRGVGNIVSDIPGGVLVQRIGARRVIIACFGLSAITALIIAWSTAFWLIGLAKAVMGFANAVLTLGMMAYVRRTVAAEHRGRALSFAGGSLRVGMLVGPLVGGFLAERFAVPAAFQFQAAVTVAGLLLTAVGMKPPPRAGLEAEDGSGDSERGTAAATAQAAGPMQAGAITRLRAGLRGQGFKLATVGFSIFTLMLLRAARQIIMPLWGDSLGMSPATIGQIMSVSAAVELLIFIPAGFIMDGAGRKVAASLCIGVFSAGVMLLPTSGGVVGFLILGLVIGIGNGFGSGINMTIGTDLAPDEAIGEFLGLWRLFGDVGAAIGPFIVGAVAAALTLPTALLVTGGIGVVGTMVMAFVAPETREPSRATQPTGGNRHQ